MYLSLSLPVPLAPGSRVGQARWRTSRTSAHRGRSRCSAPPRPRRCTSRRVRSHWLFRERTTGALSRSGVMRMSGGAKRQRDRTRTWPSMPASSAATTAPGTPGSAKYCGTSAAAQKAGLRLADDCSSLPIPLRLCCVCTSSPAGPLSMPLLKLNLTNSPRTWLPNGESMKRSSLVNAPGCSGYLHRRVCHIMRMVAPM